MALLDVTSLLTDIDLVDSFTATRHKEVVDNWGRSTLVDINLGEMRGVIYPASITRWGPNIGLLREENYQITPSVIVIVTQFVLQSQTLGYQPDTVVWQGSNYLVQRVELFNHYASGFVRAICENTDREMSLLTSLANTRTVFNDQRNSANICYLPS